MRTSVNTVESLTCDEGWDVGVGGRNIKLEQPSAENAAVMGVIAAGDLYTNDTTG